MSEDPLEVVERYHDKPGPKPSSYWEPLINRAMALVDTWGYLTGNVINEDPDLSAYMDTSHRRRELFSALMRRENRFARLNPEMTRLVTFNVPNRPGGVRALCFEDEKKIVTIEINRQRHDKEASIKPIGTRAVVHYDKT
jgi:hypothetical protein